MPQDVWVILHGGHGQLSFVNYLSQILLHLLAFAAVALVTRMLVSVFAAMIPETATESDTETQER